VRQAKSGLEAMQHVWKQVSRKENSLSGRQERCELARWTRYGKDEPWRRPAQQDELTGFSLANANSCRVGFGKIMVGKIMSFQSP
jgi:hypothetical protein